MELQRCGWCGTEKIYVDYHDHEWGVPQWDSRNLWELLILEAFQAGLSWITILKKREAFRQAFGGFIPDSIATWGENEVETLLQNPGIVRHRAKIIATIRAAQAYQRIEQAQGFAAFLWDHQGGQVQQNSWENFGQVPTRTEVSIQLAKSLKAEGFSFCGPTIAYAFMQAAGMVNDHLISCPCHQPITQMPQKGLAKALA